MSDHESNSNDVGSSDESSTSSGWQSDNNVDKNGKATEENLAADVADEEDDDNESDSASDSDQLEQMEEGERPKWDEDSVQPLCLAFDSISYTVKVSAGGGIKGCCGRIKDKKNPFKKVNKEVLHPMSGHFLPGRLVAILGPSGAGKTSFLNLLSGRLKSGKLEGKLTVNGSKRKMSSFKKYSAYVMQEDTLLGNLTPKELITYAALLRLPRSMPRKQKLARVEWVLKKLGLERCQKTRVGTPGEKRGISGGERRRVSIGLELITNPNILFLDEPTSGLDSTTAEHIVQILKDLASEGRTIVCTIHQPSSTTFQMFDDLFLLANGDLTYSGPISEVPKWFKKMGYPCPKFMNPADHIMKVMSRSEDVPEEQFLERVKSFVDFREKNNNIVSISDKEKSRNIDLTAPPSINHKGPRWYTQFYLLLRRAWSQYIRDPGVTKARLMQNLVVAIIVGLMFLQLGHDQNGITNRAGVIFLCIINAVFSTGNQVLYLFPLERPTFLREYANGMYGVGAYYLAKSSADTPFNIIFPIIFSTITYWMVGLNTSASAFFTFLGFIIIIANIAQSIGFLVSVALDLKVALGLFPVTVIPMMLVGGLFLNVDNIPYYFIWLQYISYVFYAFVALAINEFKGENFHCSGSQAVNGTCPVTSGDKVLSNLDFDQYEIWECAVALIVIYIILRCFTFLALWALAKKKGTG